MLKTRLSLPSVIMLSSLFHFSSGRMLKQRYKTSHQSSDWVPTIPMVGSNVQRYGSLHQGILNHLGCFYCSGSVEYKLKLRENLDTCSIYFKGWVEVTWRPCWRSSIRQWSVCHGLVYDGAAQCLLWLCSPILEGHTLSQFLQQKAGVSRCSGNEVLCHQRSLLSSHCLSLFSSPHHTAALTACLKLLWSAAMAFQSTGLIDLAGLQHGDQIESNWGASHIDVCFFFQILVENGPEFL